MENTINVLERILGFRSNVFDAPVTRKHYTSTTGSWGPRYVPPKVHADRTVSREKPEFSATQMKMLDLVKKNNIAMTSLEISKKIKCCQNHASLSMHAFFKKGWVKRKLVCSGRHRWYVNYVNEEQLNAFNQKVQSDAGRGR